MLDDSWTNSVRERAALRPARRGARDAVALLALTMLGVMLLGLTLAAPAWAQTVLVGKVSDESGAPIQGADVQVSTVQGRFTTDADGWFRVTGVPTGLYYFGVRRIGYRPAADLLRYSSGDTLDVMLERISPELDTVKVQARADANWMRDLRRYELAIDASRFGTVISEDDIAKRRPIWTSDLFNTQPGFMVSGGGAMARVLSSRGRCTPILFLDGQVARGFSVNDVAPSFIKLMVVYRSANNAPAQFQVLGANPNCGLIAIFTM